jgi:hypothetical protein
MPKSFLRKSSRVWFKYRPVACTGCDISPSNLPLTAGGDWTRCHRRIQLQTAGHSQQAPGHAPMPGTAVLGRSPGNPQFADCRSRAWRGTYQRPRLGDDHKLPLPINMQHLDRVISDGRFVPMHRVAIWSVSRSSPLRQPLLPQAQLAGE